MTAAIRCVGVIGGGIVGKSWAIVFSRGGVPVKLFDSTPEVLEKAPAAIERLATDLQANGLLNDQTTADVMGRIRFVSTIEDLCEGVDYVQECVPEVLDFKLGIFEKLDALAEPGTILASSTSSIPCSSFTEKLAGRHRCIVAHPVNPPYLIPLVEVCPAPWTQPEVVQRTKDLMLLVKQSPIVAKKEIDSFILNRLQGALLNECFKLVGGGFATCEDIDKCIKDGLGLRWAFMGAFETIDLNAPGGVADYIERYGGNMYRLAQSQATAEEWNADVAKTVADEVRSQRSVEELPARLAWRDQRLMGLVKHKREMDALDAQKKAESS